MLYTPVLEYCTQYSGGCAAGVGFPAGARNYSLFHRVHTVFHPMRTGGAFPGGKAVGA
jgi:hypothetical protein